MTFREYIPEAMRTAIYKNREMKISCALFGIIGEYTELMDKRYNTDNVTELQKELGDCFWYLASLCDEFGYIPTPTPMKYFHEDLDLVFFGIFYEYMKKMYRKYDYNPPTEMLPELCEYLNHIYYVLVEWVSDLKSLAFEGLHEGQILQQNLNKLKDRQARGVLHSSGDNR